MHIDPLNVMLGKMLVACTKGFLLAITNLVVVLVSVCMFMTVLCLVISTKCHFKYVYARQYVHVHNCNILLILTFMEKIYIVYVLYFYSEIKRIYYKRFYSINNHV